MENNGVWKTVHLWEAVLDFGGLEAREEGSGSCDAMTCLCWNLAAKTL